MREMTKSTVRCVLGGGGGQEGGPEFIQIFRPAIGSPGDLGHLPFPVSRDLGFGTSDFSQVQLGHQHLPAFVISAGENCPRSAKY